MRIKIPEIKFNGKIYNAKNYGKDLTLNNLGIKSIKDIKGLNKMGVNIQRLELNNNQLEDLQGIEFMPNLKYLTIEKNKLKDISNIANLSNLTKLELEKNQIQEMKGLENLTKLTSISLKENNISEIRGLENLTKLTSISLEENYISEIRSLENLKDLWSLYLNENRIEKISGLDGLSRLRVLHLANNKISKIENLENLINLDDLDLTSNQINKIENLELPNLTKLQLDENNISKIEGLDNLQKLEWLFLQNNQISKIECLEGLKTLEWLELDDNQIIKIEGLQSLKALTELRLSHNRIEKIEGLEDLTHLEDLNLNSNIITKIENLHYFNNLETLKLKDNPLPESILQLKGQELIEICQNPPTNLPQATPDMIEAHKVRLKEEQELNAQIQAIAPQRNELVTKGLNYEKNLQLRQALLCYDRALELDPYASWTWGIAGWLYYLLGDKIKAAEYFNKAIELVEKSDNNFVKMELGPLNKKLVLIMSGRSYPYGINNTRDLNEAIRRRNKISSEKTDQCLYCSTSLPLERDYQINCEEKLHKVMEDINKRLPEKAGASYKIKTKGTQSIYHYSKWWNTLTYVGKKEIDVKVRPKENVQPFYPRNFPSLKGALCEKCANQFLEGAKDCISKIKTTGKNEKISNSMKQCMDKLAKLINTWLDKIK